MLKGRFLFFVALLAGMAGAIAQGLVVDSGLANYQVAPCDAEGNARFTLGGTAAGAVMVQGRVTATAKELVGWVDLGKAAQGRWQGVIEAVPAGGPYRVELRALDEAGSVVASTAVYEVLAGDLWVLAGQSNMQGVGNRKEEEAPHPQVHVFAMNYTWRLATEPLHILGESPDPVHCSAESEEKRQQEIANWRDGPKGAGLGLAFAKEMLRRTGRPVGLVASAHGGTSMAQWDPALRDQGGASLYGSMCQQVEAAGGAVRGVLWYQGESDANVASFPVFLEKFKALVEAIRRDFDSPELPFYYVQIGRFVNPEFDPVPWHWIQTEQLVAETQLPRCGMVASIDLALDDAIHAGTPGLKTLGYRLANLAERDLFGAALLAGPRLERIERGDSPYGAYVRVIFSGVNDGLTAAGRVQGFSIGKGPAGPNYPCIFKQEIDPENPNAVVLWVAKLPADPHLWYGRGLDPYCNVVDAANMALPVFGPIAILE